MRSARFVGAALAALLGLGACQGQGLTERGGSRASGSPDATAERGASRADVNVPARDLMPVDAYFSAGRDGSNTRWILGNEVSLIASKEYFSSMLSVNRGPFVRRTDRREGDDVVVTLEFLGAPSQRSAANNPRVQLGTALTISAAEVLHVRLAKTRDPSVPVQFHVTARGEAVAGHREEVIQRGERLVLGGRLVKSGARWVWTPTR